MEERRLAHGKIVRERLVEDALRRYVGWLQTPSGEARGAGARWLLGQLFISPCLVVVLAEA